jgi:hypothetical protein
VPNRTDESIITWYSCADSSCSNPRIVGISNGNIPLQTYTLQEGYLGNYLEATIQPKWDISNPGTAVTVIATTPIAVMNIVSTTDSPNFLNFPPNPESAYISGYWTVLGTWTSEPTPIGGTFVNNWGLRASSQGAALLYQTDTPVGDEQVSVVMTPEKTAGRDLEVPALETIQPWETLLKMRIFTLNMIRVQATDIRCGSGELPIRLLKSCSSCISTSTA